jgi:hypothetical protein
MMDKTTIGTQVFVRVNRERKQLEHTDETGRIRPLEVEIDFKRCGTCAALVLTTDGQRHFEWHLHNAGRI